MKKLVFLLIFFFCYSYTSEFRAEILNKAPRQGDVVLIKIFGPDDLKEHLKNFSGNFNGKKICFFEIGGYVYGLCGIDVEMAPGAYNLSINYFDGQKNIPICESLLNVSAGDFPKRKFNRGALNKNNEERLKKEKNEKSAILSRYSEETLFNQTFKNPLEKMFQTDAFGIYRVSQYGAYYHKGIDLRASVGTKIKSINNGKVVLAAEYLAEGKIIIIDHGRGLFSVYMHCSKILAKDGQMVKRGEVIALSGATGNAHGPHLHFEIWISGSVVDPYQVLNI